ENRYLSPNCTILGSPAVVIRPNWLLSMLLSGSFRFVWFRTLLDSIRNSMVWPSRIVNVRDRPNSTVQAPGPRRIAWPAVPSFPRAGTANASRSYHQHVGFFERRSVLHWLPRVLLEIKSGRWARALAPVAALSKFIMG